MTLTPAALSAVKNKLPSSSRCLLLQAYAYHFPSRPVWAHEVCLPIILHDNAYHTAEY